MRIVITFLGLIAHLSLTSSNTAVLPVMSGHSPTLFIIKRGCADVVEPLAGKHVRIYGGKMPFSRRLGDVPSLREVASCQTPRSEVDQLKPNAAVATYVQIMDGGVLASTVAHTRRMHFDSAPASSLWSVPHCSSCRVEYRAKSTREDGTLLLTVADIGADPATATKYYIASTDSVFIMNESHGGAADDFKAYESLFASCDPNAIPKEDAPVACGTAPVCINADKIPEACRSALERDPKTHYLLAVFLVSPSVGCTNTQWP